MNSKSRGIISCSIASFEDLIVQPMAKSFDMYGKPLDFSIGGTLMIGLQQGRHCRLKAYPRPSYCCCLGGAEIIII